jgi:predicted nucleotidyltransferase component of viral defense system
MNNAMQLKAIVNKMSKAKNISSQIIMQNYMLERLLERISLSPYQPNFILKGGFLIAAIVGLDTRATMDMDATLRGMPVNAETIAKMFEEICHIPVNDDIAFAIKRTGEIRENADYTGLRVTLEALYPPMTVPLKIDITTGDKITPREIVYEYKLLLEQRSIKVLAYNLETLISEKLETVISRGDQNTRPRDYYDIYIIRQLLWQNINAGSLRSALRATAQNRNTLSLLGRYAEILQTVEKSDIMNSHWVKYQTQFDYAKDIRFKYICTTVREILDSIFLTE